MFAVALLAGAAPGSAQTADAFFNGAVLHDIHLRVNVRDWATLKRTFELDTRYPCNFTWGGITVRDAAIRSRGFGSRSGVKPGLDVEFDRYRDGQRFVGLRSLVLDNHLQDPSMLRERIGMLFYQRLGWPAPREAHVRLFVNDEYVGLYSAVEDVNEDFLEHHFGVGPDTIAASGYLYEYRWRFQYGFSHLGRELEKYEEIFEPKIKAHRSIAELLGPVEDMIRTINDSGENFAARVAEHLDLRALMTFLGIGVYLADWDGFLGDFGVNNLYLARFEPRKFERFIPWDKDNVIVSQTGNPREAIDWPILHNVSDNVLASKAIAVPELREAYLAELLRCAEAAAGWMEGEIVRQFDRIRDAAFADPVKPWTNDQMVEAVDYLLRFARARPDVVRAQVAAAR